MSDQDTSIFDEATPTGNAAPVGDQNTTVDYNEVLKQITDNDGRQKYESVEKALEALPHAQTHISKLETEMADLREELAKQNAAEELLAQVKAGKEPTSSQTLDPNVITKLVNDTIQTNKAAEVAATNKKSVGDAVLAHYGDRAKAEEAFNAKSQALGVDLVALSATSPAAALELLGINKQANHTPAKSDSTMRTENIPDINKPQEIKPVMGVSTTKEVLDTWRACAPTQE